VTDLCCRLVLFSDADPESPNYNAQSVQAANEAAKEEIRKMLTSFDEDEGPVDDDELDLTCSLCDKIGAVHSADNMACPDPSKPMMGLGDHRFHDTNRFTPKHD
jgi:hypothetical protein